MRFCILVVSLRHSLSVPQSQLSLDTPLQPKRLTKVLFALCHTSAVLALEPRLFSQSLVMVLVAEMERATM
jgi:hypothetical protein